MGPNHVRSMCKIDCSKRWNDLTIRRIKKMEKRKQFAVLVYITRVIARAPLLDLEGK